MAWRALQSNHMLGAEYDEELGILSIRFVNGALYRYAQVPATVADSLFQVPSPGTYFHDKIKGVYPESKVVDGVTKRGRRSVRRFK